MASLHISKKEEGQKSTLCQQIMGAVFWNVEESILVEFLPKGETIKVARYIQTQETEMRTSGKARYEKKLSSFNMTMLDFTLSI